MYPRIVIRIYPNLAVKVRITGDLGLLVTADKKIPAGTFTPAGDGSAVVRATYALSPTDLKAITITAGIRDRNQHLLKRKWYLQITDSDAR